LNFALEQLAINTPACIWSTGGLTDIHVTTNDLVTKSLHSPIRDAHPLAAELSVSNLLRQMVSASDGTACDVLFAIAERPPIGRRLSPGVWVDECPGGHYDKEMGQDETRPVSKLGYARGMIGLLRMLHEGHGLSVRSRELLLRFLTETSTGSRCIRGLLPP